MITYDEIITKELPFDASGIDLPQNYLWAKISSDVYYPKMRIVTEIDVSEYEDGLFILVVNCISAVNHDTEVADYSYFYCEWDSHNLQGDAFEWQFRGADADECPPFYEEVEKYIEIAYLQNIIKAPTHTNQTELHLKHMVELIEELQGTELIHLQEDMPQEYGKFVLAKQYVTKFLAILLVAFTLVGCQRDVATEMTEAEWQTLEVINSLEDAKEYIINDIEEGNIDSDRAYPYLLIIDESIDNLQTLKTK